MTTILVVDDSAVDRRLVGGLLEKDSGRKAQYATNGSEALAQMKEAAPDLVITDLQMPEMDGLELVAATRVHHPHVPIILITAYGSETLAVEALEQGAASYVPKSQLADKLSRTVNEVLGLARADHGYAQLIECMASTEYTFYLENNPALIDALVDLIQQTVEGVDFCDFTGRLQIGVALKEALSNALYRGNLEISTQPAEGSMGEIPEDGGDLVEQRRSRPPYCDRRIFVVARISREELEFVVRDEGPGFDVSAIPDAHDQSALVPEKGRGLSLMRTFMDEVSFNDVGNEVTMVKRRGAKLSKA